MVETDVYFEDIGRQTTASEHPSMAPAGQRVLRQLACTTVSGEHKCSIIEFVARTRIEKARNLLQNPNLRISEVAFEIGFQSLSQFNRTFKKVTGRRAIIAGSSLVFNDSARRVAGKLRLLAI